MSDTGHSSGGGSAAAPLEPSARYRVIGLAGEGGMGVVYRAHDRLLDREVALKRLSASALMHSTGSLLTGSFADSASSGTRRDGVSAQVMQLFRREYHTLAQLAHPNIIEVYDYGIDAHGPYYTMELLEGEDLRSLGTLPWPRACAILRDVASALTLLHARGFLHRDISPRNVFCLHDGRAKLIDFGTMTPIGAERMVAGTPPFVPPEVLSRQALDARADVYALGALLFWMLTGRHAYPAKSVRQLQDLWRSLPSLPSRFTPGIPGALDALVMRMLSLDRHGRPSTALELVERLGALAGLEPQAEQSAVDVRAYMTTPKLVGRERQLLRVRRRSLRALAGRGASFFVSGAPGSGRSRFLDACGLEVKLAGALLLRVDRGDAASGDYGGICGLLDELESVLPEDELFAFPDAARAWMRERQRPNGRSAEHERSAMQDAVQGYLSELASRRLLAIVADDLQALDEPSVVLLASLAQLARDRKLILISACDSETPMLAPEPARVLRELSRPIGLHALSEEQTEELLQSIFGDVQNLKLLSARIHPLCLGRPLLCMQLVQHLLERGVIKHQAAGFVLPDELASADLPASLTEALEARVAALSEEARALGAILALAGSVPLSLEECIEVTGAIDFGASYAAASDLTGAQIARLERGRLRLASGYGPLLEAGLCEPKRRALQARLGALFDGEALRYVRAAQHYLEAGRGDAAVDALLRYVREPRAQQHWFSDYRPVFEAAIKTAREIGRPALDVFTLRYGLARACLAYFEPAESAQLLLVAEELHEAAGARIWERLHDEPDVKRRIERALALAAERHNAKPEHERTLAPGAAIAAFVQYTGLLGAYASAANDVELLYSAPSLAAFASLSPSIGLVELILRALRDMRADRSQAALNLLRRCLLELDAADFSGLEPERRHATRLRLLYGVGVLEAALGIDSALGRADSIAVDPDQRLNAWRIRHLVHLYRPDALRAEDCRQQIELLRLQGGPRQYSEGTTITSELLAYARTDDLLGVQRVKPEIAAMAEKHPGWLPWLRIAEGEIERMRDRVEAALPLYAEAIALAEPRRHVVWMHATTFYLDALVQLGRFEQARTLGREWVVMAERLGSDSVHLIAAPLALAEAELGEHDTARKRAELALSVSQHNGLSGIYLGAAFETLARLSIVVRDADGFKHYLGRCVEEFGYGRDSPLSARLEQLKTSARRAHIYGPDSEQSDAPVLDAVRARRELAACDESGSRATVALALLLDCGAAAGHLFGLRGAELELLASRAPRPPSEQLEQLARAALNAEHDADRTQPLHEQARAKVNDASLGSLERDGFLYRPALLVSNRGGQTTLAGVAVLGFAQGKQRMPPPEVLKAIARELLSKGDVTGMILA